MACEHSSDNMAGEAELSIVENDTNDGARTAQIYPSESLRSRGTVVGRSHLLIMAAERQAASLSATASEACRRVATAVLAGVTGGGVPPSVGSLVRDTVGRAACGRVRNQHGRCLTSVVMVCVHVVAVVAGRVDVVGIVRTPVKLGSMKTTGGLSVVGRGVRTDTDATKEGVETEGVVVGALPSCRVL